MLFLTLQRLLLITQWFYTERDKVVDTKYIKHINPKADRLFDKFHIALATSEIDQQPQKKRNNPQKRHYKFILKMDFYITQFHPQNIWYMLWLKIKGNNFLFQSARKNNKSIQTFHTLHFRNEVLWYKIGGSKQNVNQNIPVLRCGVVCSIALLPGIMSRVRSPQLEQRINLDESVDLIRWKICTGTPNVLGTQAIFSLFLRDRLLSATVSRGFPNQFICLCFVSFANFWLNALCSQWLLCFTLLLPFLHLLTHMFV